MATEALKQLSQNTEYKNFAADCKLSILISVFTSGSLQCHN